MKFLSDLFPVLLFFAAYSLSRNIYMATSVAIAASMLQVGWLLVRRRKVEIMQWVSLVLIVVFGGATLLLHNKHFIMWKPTVLYWLMAAALIISERMGKNGLRVIMGKQLNLPEFLWRKLSFAWASFFTLVGGLNLLVAYYCSEDVWVKFKLFGVVGLLVVFAIGQSLLLAKYIEEE
jgi:intracellular septation protein